MTKTFLFAVGVAMLSSSAFSQRLLGDLIEAYGPTIEAADFSHVISNKYFTLAPGMKAGYEQQTPTGVLSKQIDVQGETKQVMGITTLVVRQREWLDGELIEETKSWVAQDKNGNVWNFGEAVEYFKHGMPLNHDGWEAGVDGAKPGVLMLSEPTAGASYRTEYRPGKAEDMRTVIAVRVSVTIPEGPLFQNCVHIREWSALEESDVEDKFYCVGVGAMVLEKERADAMKLVTFSKGLESPPYPIRRAASVP
jgi:hypothetical protein